MDKEKIINALEWHIRTTKARECKYALVDCPYVEECRTIGSEKLFEDTLALLKEYQNNNGCETCAMAVEDRPFVVRCKDCKHYDRNMIYCNKFGIQNIHNDWFCADGVNYD